MSISYMYSSLLRSNEDDFVGVPIVLPYMPAEEGVLPVTAAKRLYKLDAREP